MDRLSETYRRTLRNLGEDVEAEHAHLAMEQRVQAAEREVVDIRHALSLTKALHTMRAARAISAANREIRRTRVRLVVCVVAGGSACWIV